MPSDIVGGEIGYMSSRKILVLGATGGTGREVVSQGLQQGHEVTAFLRPPERMATRAERLRVIVGDVTSDGEALDEAVRSQDAVISALGIGKSFRPRRLMARSVPRILDAMRRQGVRRLIFTSAFGLGDTWRDTPFLPRIFIRTLLRAVYADKAAGEEILQRSELDWTLVYPTGLTSGPRTGRYRAGERLKLTGFPTISRADVADFLLRQVEDRTYIRKGVLISN
jgi:putative NADH-flavin reductase